MSRTRMPALFLGHGSPMNVLEDNRYTRAWAQLGETLPRPKAIVVVSAHWFTRGTGVTAMEAPKTIHDFGGFPQALYDTHYPAPGSPALAQRLVELLSPVPVTLDTEAWGFDHGSWGVLIKMYIHFNQHAPRAMVKSPGFCIEGDRHRREQLHQPLRQRRRARRRIMRVIQRLRKTAEVMNGLRRLHRRYARTARKPVRRDHHDRFRTRQGFAQLSPGAGITVVFQHVHWAAMAEKQRGHSGTGHDDILRVSM